MGNTKYNDGNPQDISEISEGERKAAFREWSEGNKQLEKLLWYSQEKGMLTMASCGGHDEKNGHAYVAFDLQKGNTARTIDILAMMDEENMQFEIGFISQNRSVGDKTFTAVSAAKTGINEAFFEGINNICQEIDNGKQPSPAFKEKYELLKSVILDKRMQRYDRGTQICIGENGEKCTARGFLQYTNDIIAAPIDEMLKFGKSLKENPGTEIPYQLNDVDIINPQINIQNIKNIANKSKTPISFLRNSYDKIKETLQHKFNKEKNYSNDKEGVSYGEL